MSNNISGGPAVVFVSEDNAERITTTELPMPRGGKPVHDSWPVFKSGNGKVRSGIWQSTTGAWVTEIVGYTEFCHIIEGAVRVTDQDGRINDIKAGDTFVMPDGFIGHWEVDRFVKKYFVIADT